MVGAKREMVRLVEQDSFLPQDFDDTRFNVHVRRGTNSKSLVVLIHGYNGEGYGTWAKMPQMLFDGTVGPSIDVALFDYKSARRKFFTGGARLELQERRLTQLLNELDGYESIYLVGHSLGGVIALAAAERFLQASNAIDEQLTKLAGLVTFCSPRAGSGFSKITVGRERRWLRRFSDRTARIDEYFSTYVETRVTPSAGTHARYLLPSFVCMADGDIVVDPFSAAFSVPEPQRKVLTGTHSSVVKPSETNHPQVDWLYQCIAEIGECRTQRRREIEHASLVKPTDPLPVYPYIVTELWSGSQGLEWEEAYNQVRAALAASYFEVHDLRNMSNGARTDLLISVHDAADVLVDEPVAVNATKKAHLLFTQQGNRLSVGISPVGPEAAKAEVQINSWLHGEASGGSFFIEGAPDVDSLRLLMERWMRLVIDRDPRRLQVGLTRGRERQPGPDFYDETRMSGLR